MFLYVLCMCVCLCAVGVCFEAFTALGSVVPPQRVPFLRWTSYAKSRSLRSALWRFLLKDFFLQALSARVSPNLFPNTLTNQLLAAYGAHSSLVRIHFRSKR